MKHLSLFMLFAALLTQPAAAHEFWMTAQPFTVREGDATRLSLHVGEHFEGTPVGFSAGHAASMRKYSTSATTDLGAQLPSDAAAQYFLLPSLPAGNHVITYDSRTSTITLSADKFHAYLHEEGLDKIIRQREAAGTAQLPGRERYRRHVKTILQAGGASDQAYARRTGQRLEILPLANPYEKAAGDRLAFRLYFDGRPLAGALLKAWHRGDGETFIIRAVTNTSGEVNLSLPYGGVWMLSTVHMLAAAGTDGIDWDSFWGNLSFALPDRRTRP